MFDKKQTRTGEASAVQRPEEPIRSRSTLLDQLKRKRSEAMNEVVALNFRIQELDGQINWLSQYPQLEAIVESLRGT